MTAANLGIVALGVVLAPIALVTWGWVFDRIYPKGAGENVTGRELAQILLATAAACLIFGVVILIPLLVFGLYPLHANSPIFGWSFLISALAWVFGIRLWHHIRGLIHARNTDS